MWLPQNVFVDTAVLLLLRPNGIYVRSWSILHAIVRLSFDLSLLTVLTFFVFFFFNDPAPPEISTLPLPDPLPIPAHEPGARGPADVQDSQWDGPVQPHATARRERRDRALGDAGAAIHHDSPRRSRRQCDGVFRRDRKSTRLNSSHGYISYAVFCLK